MCIISRPLCFNALSSAFTPIICYFSSRWYVRLHISVRTFFLQPTSPHSPPIKDYRLPTTRFKDYASSSQQKHLCYPKYFVTRICGDVVLYERRYRLISIGALMFNYTHSLTIWLYTDWIVENIITTWDVTNSLVITEYVNYIIIVIVNLWCRKVNNLQFFVSLSSSVSLKALFYKYAVFTILFVNIFINLSENVIEKI